MRISDWSSDVCSSDLAGDRLEAETGFSRPSLVIPIAVTFLHKQAFSVNLGHYNVQFGHCQVSLRHSRRLYRRYEVSRYRLKAPPLHLKVNPHSHGPQYP